RLPRSFGGDGSGHRGGGVGCPVGGGRDNRRAGPAVQLSWRKRMQGDAVLNRADIDAEIAAYAFLVHHLEMADAIDDIGNRLVRRILAGNMAATALDAQILVDVGFGDIVEVQVLPVGDVSDG